MSTRLLLPEDRIAPEARTKMSTLFADTIREVEGAVRTHDVVVVGMAQNPHVRRAKRALDDAQIAYHSLSYGSYVSEWRRRLAIKCWSGWPTFPQVFVKGVLLGGADLTKAAIASGDLAKRLGGARVSGE